MRLENKLFLVERQLLSEVLSFMGKQNIAIKIFWVEQCSIEKKILWPNNAEIAKVTGFCQLGRGATLEAKS